MGIDLTMSDPFLAMMQQPQPRRRSASKGRSRWARTFTADVLDGKHLLVSGASVELWTRDPQVWHGQLLFLARAGVNAGRVYVLETPNHRRTVAFLDVAILKGFCWVLFEQPGKNGVGPSADSQD